MICNALLIFSFRMRIGNRAVTRIQFVGHDRSEITEQCNQQLVGDVSRETSPTVFDISDRDSFLELCSV